jgi:hypothetical protein
MKHYLILGAIVSALLTAGVIYAIESGLTDRLATFDGLLIVVGALLLYTSAFCLAQIRVEKWARREKQLMLFGPVLSSAFVGLGSISAGLYEAKLLAGLWWLPLALLLSGFVTFQVAVILAIQILWQRWHGADAHPTSAN